MAPKKGGLKVGTNVWVKDPAIAGTDLFTKGAILAIDDKGKATVETSNGIKTQELILPLSECHMPHPADDVPDHCQLMYLSQPTLPASAGPIRAAPATSAKLTRSWTIREQPAFTSAR